MINIGFEALDTYTKLPTKSTKNAACLDCYLSKNHQPLMPGEVRIVPLGFKLDIPEGFKVMVYGRSGLASKGILCHTGTIDADYTGEVGVILTNISGAIQPLNQGDRVCQLTTTQVYDIEWRETNVIKETDRSPDGFGSSQGFSEQTNGDTP